MPKLLIIKKYVFLIYSSDLSEKRMHIHIESRKGRFRKTAKFWLEPRISLVDAGDFSNKELNYIKNLIEVNLELIKKQIEKFSKGEKVKTIIVK